MFIVIVAAEGCSLQKDGLLYTSEAANDDDDNDYTHHSRVR